MVLVSCIIIIAILYFLQTNGIIYALAIAVGAELINLFLTQTLSKTVETKTNKKFGEIIGDYKRKIAFQQKTIQELKKIRDDSVHKLYRANQTIKKYEEKLGITESEIVEVPRKPQKKKAEKPAAPEQTKEKPKEEFVDLPDGSGKKELPI